MSASRLLLEQALRVPGEQGRSQEWCGHHPVPPCAVELNIEIICANSSQAKGRVERANRTLQDRLVKELRLENVCDMDTGSAFLPEFLVRYNKHFAAAAQA